MTPVHIIGQPGSGKTTLVAALVKHFRAASLAVGTLKHSSHSHELDKPGKDSHVHRTAGASPAAMVTASMAAVYLPASDQTRPDAIIQTYFKNLDVVLIEGWISGPYPKIEIWQSIMDKPPFFYQVENVAGIVTDGPLPEDILNPAKEKQIACLQLDDLQLAADFILSISTDTK
jgi:molybdopterin-guanine dinucleotide biosynthesis protein B